VRFDWTEYLTLARELVGDSAVAATPEARRRAAISRAYYAAYGAARQLLVTRGEYANPDRSGSHEAVIRLFREHPARGRQDLGRDLDRLRRAREIADYQADTEVGDDLATAALARAARIVNGLRRV